MAGLRVVDLQGILDQGGGLFQACSEEALAGFGADAE